MGEEKKFSERIKERLARNLEERRDRVSELNKGMEELLDKKNKCEETAGRILKSVVYPRLRALAENFDNAEVSALDSASPHCSCRFSHTPRFPATVMVEFAFLPDQDYEALDLRYSLSIYPMLMEYDKGDDRIFPLDTISEADISAWVEEKLLNFLETYLKLETHPLYQKDNLVVDPVCGMRIPITSAADMVVESGRTTYFCSKACKADFLKKKKE